MNDTQEEAFRNLAASVTALGHITEVLLMQYLKSFPEPYRTMHADLIVRSGKKTDGLTGAATSEELAELTADVVVKMHAHLEDYVHRAMLRIEAGEESGAR